MYAGHLKVVVGMLLEFHWGVGVCPRLNATLFLYLLYVMHGECVHMPISCQVPSQGGEFVNYIIV